MTERTLPERLRKEAARGDAKAGEECCNAPWTCCDPKLLLEAADAIDAKSALLAEAETALEEAQVVIDADDCVETYHHISSVLAKLKP